MFNLYTSRGDKSNQLFCKFSFTTCHPFFEISHSFFWNHTFFFAESIFLIVSSNFLLVVLVLLMITFFSFLILRSVLIPLDLLVAEQIILLGFGIIKLCVSFNFFSFPMVSFELLMEFSCTVVRIFFEFLPWVNVGRPRSNY